jgi:thiamine pyrophosphokinase
MRIVEYRGALPLSTIALVAASDFNATHFMMLDCASTFDSVFAIDGGFASLESIGRKPDVALGDFDSLGYVPHCKRVVRFPVKKDKSDLELGLDRALTHGATEVFVYGALGRRLDHTLANLQLFARFAEQGMAVTAIGEQSAVRALAGPDAFELPRYQAGTVSVFAATDQATGVIERGMAYAFNDEALTNRTSRGLSNELTGEPAAVAVETGTLYVFYPLQDAASA